MNAPELLTMAIDELARMGVLGARVFWAPLLAWTVVAVPATLLLRVWRRAHPLVQYTAHVALLMALPLGFAGFAAASWLGAEVSSGVLPQGTVWLTDLAFEGEALEGRGPVAERPAASKMDVLCVGLGVVTLAAWLLGLLRLLHLLVKAAKLRVGLAGLCLRRSGWLEARAAVLAEALNVRAPIRCYVCADDVPPMTYGWRRHRVLIPTSIARDENSLLPALTHELVHVRRRDHAVHWMERLVVAVLAVHPLVAYIRHRADHFREVSCDAEVLFHTGMAPATYAGLLLSLSGRAAGYAEVSMVRPGATLKGRLTAMKEMMQNGNVPSSMLRGRSVLTTALLVTLVCGPMVLLGLQNARGQQAGDTGGSASPTVHITAGSLIVNGKRVADVGDLFGESPVESNGWYLSLLLPPYGNFVISNRPFEGAAPSGRFEANLLQFDFGGRAVQIASATDILARPDAVPAWVRHQALEPGVTLTPEQWSLGVSFSLEQAVNQREVLNQIEEASRRARSSGRAPSGLGGNASSSALGMEDQKPKLAGASDTVFTVVEQMPRPAGGIDSLRAALTLRPPGGRSVEGKSFLTFVIDKEGNTGQITVVHSLGAAYDEAAIRAIEGLKFEPGQQAGQPVNVKFSVPVTFRLSQE